MAHVPAGGTRTRSAQSCTPVQTSRANPSAASSFWISACLRGPSARWTRTASAAPFTAASPTAGTARRNSSRRDVRTASVNGQ
ncbi:hypothetical protein BJF78_28415 [Pseudonocardia sp. CNS-139]|nr:hypothetical protein BJF78_28415 [Pseudonocardia sp. CNS-139]